MDFEAIESRNGINPRIFSFWAVSDTGFSESIHIALPLSIVITIIFLRFNFASSEGRCIDDRIFSIFSSERRCSSSRRLSALSDRRMQKGVLSTTFICDASLVPHTASPMESGRPGPT